MIRAVTPATATADLFAQAQHFLRKVEDGVATRRIDGPLGTTLVNDDYPAAHSMNLVRLAPTNASGEEVESAITAAMDGVARQHLEAIVPDAALGARLAPDLRRRGWTVTELSLMAWLRPTSREPGATAAVVPWEAVRPVIFEAWMREPLVAAEEVARQLTDRRDAIAQAVHLRHLVAPPPPERIGSYADLYSDGETAQIESVNTLEEFRNRGLASAVVLHAARLAQAEGHDLVFLVADADDWPMQLYQRLGFEEIGRFWELSKAR